MASQLRRTSLLALIACTALVASPLAASAYDESDLDAPPVTSDGSKLTVTLVRAGDTVAVAVHTDDADDPTSQLDCTFRAVEIPTSAEALDELGPAPTDDSIPYRIFCGSALWAATWITPADIIDYDTIARTEADRYLHTVLAPRLSIHHTPTTYAVVGAPSHHWIHGWDGQPLTIGPLNPYGQPLTIVLTLRDVTWNFGDTTPTTTADLGTTTPITHTYTTRSTTTDPHGTYTTTATITIDATYTLDNTPPTTITPPLTTTPTTTVIARELQAVLD